MNKRFQECNNQEEIQNKLKQWSDQESDKTFTQAIISKAEEMRNMARIINKRYATDKDNDENNDKKTTMTLMQKIRWESDGNEELQKIAKDLTKMTSTIMEIDSVELHMR